MRPPLATAAAVLLLLLATASPAVAISINGPQGPRVVLLEPNETALFTEIWNALFVVANATVHNVTLPEPDAFTASASVPPPNASPQNVASTIGIALAAAVMQTEELSTLGNPSVWPYNDGTGRVALYRMPVGRIKGTCTFIHGCKHDPYSWFYKSPQCPQCTGLPEEVSHSKQCLARGYAVLAVMSLDRSYRNRCFSSSGGPDKNDQKSAAIVVQAWARKFGLASKPKYIWGISSGASFAIKFPKTMWVDGMVSEVNMPWEKAWGVTDGKGKLLFRFPPTAYYMMQRDRETEIQIKKAVQILHNNGVPSEYVFVPERKVTKSYLSNRSMYISPAQSAQIQMALRKIGVLDANGLIKFDVRTSRGWITLLPKVLPWLTRSSPYYNLISDESQIWQDFVRPTLMWLEARGKSSLNGLVKRYSLDGKISCLSEKYEGCRL